MTTKLEKDTDKLLTRFQAKDVEASLTKIYGDRFVEYRKAFNKAREYYNYAGEVPDFPITVSFELTNKCNLACIMCYHGTEAAKKEKFVGLTIEGVHKLLAECKDKALPSIILGSGTELLFAKNAHEVIRLIGESGIMDVFLRTNGILMDERTIDLIFEAKISRVYVSLDAATKETYKAVRKRDALDLIESNIEKLLEERRRRNSETPIMRVSFVVLDENKHEQSLFLEKWKDKVEFVDFQNHQDLSHLQDKETNISNAEIPIPLCSYPFYSLSVLPDGDVAPCCTFYGKEIAVGNIENETLEEIWQGEKIKKLREEILTKNFNDTCKRCLFFRENELSDEIGEQTAEV